MEREVIGECCWCHLDVYEGESYELGNGGEGIMHKKCPPEPSKRNLQAAVNYLNDDMYLHGVTSYRIDLGKLVTALEAK